MPITYEIDTVRRVVFSRGYGKVTDKELLQYNNILKADPNFNPSFNQLFDFSEANQTEIKLETVYKMAGDRVFNLSSLRAYVVTPGLQYGLARMFQILREPRDKNIQVFTDIAEAKKWLGLTD